MRMVHFTRFVFVVLSEVMAILCPSTNSSHKILCFLRNVQKLKSHADTQKGGANDIQMLVRYTSSHGYAVRGPGCTKYIS